MAFPTCTLRRYDHDGAGNRTRLAVQASDEDCPVAAETGAATVHHYGSPAGGPSWTVTNGTVPATSPAPPAPWRRSRPARCGFSC
ncbi:hypothetical protein AB0G05_34940 [Nonomuraea wenchangensis]